VHCYGIESGLFYHGQTADYNGGDADGVSAGGSHTCVLTAGRNVDCYGLNDDGQAADYNGGDAVGVSAGNFHTCVLTAGGNVDCYGSNSQGQAEDYIGGNAVGVSAGSFYTCVLKSNGNVDCYGLNTDGQSADYNGGDAVGVSAGGSHTCVLKSNGNVDCYGSNIFGQAPDGVDYTGGDAVCSRVGCYNPEIRRIKQIVVRYYESILDRNPEPGGAESWVAEIERIVSLGIDINEGFIALGKLFFNSEEYLAMDKNIRGYIVDLYETFLGRTPSSGEVEDWAGELRGGLTRNLLLNYFIFSDEFRTFMEGIFGNCLSRPEYSLVNDLYRGFLSRLPEDGGFNSWLALMQEAQCTGVQAVRTLTNDIGLLFIQSAEYEARNPEFLPPPDNQIKNPDFSSEFVTNLYDAVLRRGAELAGYLDWKEHYDSDTLTKEEILQFFVASAEFQGLIDEVIAAGCFFIPLPTTEEFWSYAPIVEPIFSYILAFVKPVGVGPIAEGGDIVRIRVGLNRFAGPVDVNYMFVLSTSPNVINFLQPDGTNFLSYTTNQFLTALDTGVPMTGLQPWKENVIGPIDEVLFNEPATNYPSGTYTVFLLVTPTGTWENYYWWMTEYVIP
jgi:hypothetical protein